MGIRWTKKEESVLLDNQNKSIDDLQKLLPGRTEESIRQRRNKLGLFVGYRKWTPIENEYLIKNYSLGNPDKMCVDLDRTWVAIKIQARKLDLLRDLDTYKTTTLGNLLDMSHDSLYWIGFILADGHIAALTGKFGAQRKICPSAALGYALL